MKSTPWLSSGFLFLANVAFGYFLHDLKASEIIWILAGLYILLECGVLSIAWQPTRKLILMGFKSDLGYAAMALLGASFAVVLLVWIEVSSYFLMMLAAALLLRMDLFTRRVGPWISWVVLSIVSFLGVAVSWLPQVIVGR